MAIDCTVCGGSLHPDFVCWLPCGHVYCRSCLTSYLVVAVSSIPFRPIRCCERIDPALLRSFIGREELVAYRARLSEFDTSSKLYCWNPKCNHAFIPTALRCPRPSSENGSGSGKCRKCFTKTCMGCRERFHFGPCAPLANPLERLDFDPQEKQRMSQEQQRRAQEQRRKIREQQRRRKAKMLEEEFQKLAKLQGWKPCPKCKAMVEKTQGCNHME